MYAHTYMHSRDHMYLLFDYSSNQNCTILTTPTAGRLQRGIHTYICTKMVVCPDKVHNHHSITQPFLPTFGFSCGSEEGLAVAGKEGDEFLATFPFFSFQICPPSCQQKTSGGRRRVTPLQCPAQE